VSTLEQRRTWAREYMRRKRAAWTPDQRAAAVANTRAWRNRCSKPAIYFRDQLSAQDNKCDICGCAAEESPQGFHLDHDHAVDPRSGRTYSPDSYRGILCSSCNTGLVAAYEWAPERYASHLPTVAAYVDKWARVIHQRLAEQQKSNEPAN
jgi:hypothetical protein